MNIFIIVLFRRYVYVKTRHRLLLTERTNTSITPSFSLFDYLPKHVTGKR